MVQGYQAPQKNFPPASQESRTLFFDKKSVVSKQARQVGRSNKKLCSCNMTEPYLIY